MKLPKIFNKITARLVAAATVVIAIALPVATFAAGTVHLEGALGVANVTNQETTYKASTSATYDQVVKLQVYYHNTELPDSGKIASNLRVKIAMPNATGKTQTAQATISADNANTVNSNATVNLDNDSSYLQFIPGSAVWRHNTGTNDNISWTETKISDSVVTDGSGLVLENEKPCYNFSATVTVLARVMTPGVSIDKKVRIKGSTDGWKTSINAKAGDTVQYMIGYKNTGNTVENNVVVRDNMPPKVVYQPNTTMLKNSTNPNGVLYNSDNVTNGGIVIGNYQPGANAYVWFDAKLPAESELACGTNTIRNVGVVKPEGMNEYFNTADVIITKACTSSVKIDKKVNGSDTNLNFDVGQEFNYSIIVTNTGETDLTNLVVSDQAPANISFISSDKGDVNGNQLNYSISSLKVGTSETINIKAKITNYVASAIVNKACVDTASIQGTPDGCDTVPVTPNKPKVPGVKIDKVVNGQETYATKIGETFTYTLTVTNSGEVDLTNVVVSDKAPTNISFISSDKGDVNGNQLNYTIGSLKVGASASETINIEAKVLQYTSDTIKNTACVNAPEVNPSNPSMDDDCNDATVTVIKPGDVAVCNPSTGNIITVSETESSKYEPVNSPKCKDVRVCNPDNGKIITVKESDIDKYEAINSPKCKDIQVCNPASGIIITVKESEKDKYELANSPKCQSMNVCVISTGAHITISKDKFDDKLHSTNDKDCTDMKVCVIASKTLTTIKESAFDSNTQTSDMSKCEATPPTPAQPVTPTPAQPVATVLPNTGAGNILGIAFGVSLLATFGHYVLRARRTVSND